MIRCQKPCIECGSLFIPKRKNHTVCSDECIRNRAAVGPVDAECAYCGEPFIKTHKTKYCSDKCRSEVVRLRVTNKRTHRIVSCKYCKSEFETSLNKRLFCSRECIHKWDTMIDKFKTSGNVLYLIGFRINEVYYIKIGISKQFDGRFKRYSTSSPFPLSLYYLRSFDVISTAMRHESEVLTNTIYNQTLAANEWRKFTMDELINVLIDLNNLSDGKEIDIDAQFIGQMA